jgi:phosphoglycerate dehydrogenase-like enzyme
MTSVLILLTFPENVRNYYRTMVSSAFPELTVDVVDHHSKVGPFVGSADILITFGPMMSDHVLKDAPRLKWIQAMGTGTDGILDSPSLRPDIVVTNIRGIHGAAMSEATLLAMLALSRNLPRSVRAQDRHAWERWPSRVLHGRTVGIFGIGAIAEALAPRCKALGMTVVGITSARRTVPGFDRMHRRDELLAVVPELDYFVILTPYSPETRHAVDARVLAAMKPSSFLINVARGGVVHEEALIDSLTARKIAGAALDVFATEPLPSDHPFWGMDNVIITPHLGGFYDRYPDDAWPTIEHNMRCFLAGDFARMQNVVSR